MLLCWSIISVQIKVAKRKTQNKTTGAIKVVKV